MIPSHRGGQLLVYGGYTYYRMNSKIRWYCSKKCSGRCPAKAVTIDGGVVLINKHNH